MSVKESEDDLLSLIGVLASASASAGVSWEAVIDFVSAVQPQSTTIRSRSSQQAPKGCL